MPANDTRIRLQRVSMAALAPPPSTHAKGGPGTAALRAELARAQVSPLIESARRKTLSVQAELDALSSYVESALLQLDYNRDAALAVPRSGVIASDGDGDGAAAVRAIFASGIDSLHATAATKRAKLESELVDADAVLGEVIEVATALTEVWDRSGLHDCASLLRPSSLARFCLCSPAR